MNKINSYIDRCLIDEYAHKSFKNGYSLDLDSLPEHEIYNFLEKLMENDTKVRDLVRYEMQQLIDNRLPEVEAEDRKASGYRIVRDYQTGETSWA